MGGDAFSPAWRLPTVETDVKVARCSSRCSGSSTGTQGSFVAWRWKRRELRHACGGDPTTENRGKRVRSVRHPQEFLGEEGEVGGLTGGNEF
jgi:hypothetical protein